MDRASLRARIAAGDRFAFLPFYGHTPRGDGIDASCLSQWYPAAFELGGLRFPTAEHYMMAEKARLFEDEEGLAAILGAPGPGRAKKLGRAVRGYDEGRWARRRVAAVVEGNLAKFAQNPPLAAFLRATGDRVLVEASPTDRIWGVGLGRNHPAIADPAQWLGQNLLGFALMEVRATLGAET